MVKHTSTKPWEKMGFFVLLELVPIRCQVCNVILAYGLQCVRPVVNWTHVANQLAPAFQRTRLKTASKILLVEVFSVNLDHSSRFSFLFGWVNGASSQTTTSLKVFMWWNQFSLPVWQLICRLVLLRQSKDCSKSTLFSRQMYEWGECTSSDFKLHSFL
jgi:hypothetical protein